MTVEGLAPSAVPVPPAELRQADRCDNCGAPAMERWENGISELLFCKHDANRHRDALSADGWMVTEAWRFDPQNVAGTVGLVRVKEV